MNHRFASPDDCPLLADWNQQLIHDEGHRNPMTLAELEQRMRGWLASGQYQAVIFEEDNQAVAYALFRETDAEIYLRQFFVVRQRRREGFGRRAIRQLSDAYWPQDKRWTVDVLCGNIAATAFWREMGYTDYALTLEIMPGGQPTVRQEDQETRKQ